MDLNPSPWSMAMVEILSRSPAVFLKCRPSIKRLQFALYNWWHLPEVQAYEKNSLFRIKMISCNLWWTFCDNAHTHPEAYQTEKELELFLKPHGIPPLATSPSEFRKPSRWSHGIWSLDWPMRLRIQNFSNRRRCDQCKTQIIRRNPCPHPSTDKIFFPEMIPRILD